MTKTWTPVRELLAATTDPELQVLLQMLDPGALARVREPIGGGRVAVETIEMGHAKDVDVKIGFEPGPLGGRVAIQRGRRSA